MSNAGTALTVRPAGPADAAAVAAIWQHGWRDGHLGHVPAELVALRTPESFRVRAVERVNDAEVAVVDGTVAGFVMVAGDEVEQVYVSTTYRGSGVAARLLARAEQLVGANGHEEAWLAVAAGNARARRFYERNGWRDAGAFEYAAATADGPVAVPCHRYVKRVAR
jgi:GNAT superfamily N-acetyltransferase